MGTVISLKVIRGNSGDVASLDEGMGELHEALWVYVRDSWDMWSVTDDEEIAAYLWDIDGDRRGWGWEEDRLFYVFSDIAGSCHRSYAALVHWFLLVLSSDWRKISALFDEHGFTLGGEPPLDGGAARFVTLRGGLWCIEADTQALYSDRACIEASELSASELEHVGLAIEACACPACRFLRPADDIAANLTRLLLGDLKPEGVSCVAWYLARMSDPGRALLTAVGHAIERAPAHSEPLQDASRQLGARRALDLTDLPVVMRILLRQGRGESDPDDLGEGLSRPAPTCGIAAEIAAKEHEDDRDRFGPLFMRALDAFAGDHEETRHQLVLALINLYMYAERIPAQVIPRLEAEVVRQPRDPYLVSLLPWGLELFADRPILDD